MRPLKWFIRKHWTAIAIKKGRPFGRPFFGFVGGGGNYSGFALSPSGPPSPRSRVVSPLRGSVEPAARLHSNIERPIKNPNPVGLRFCYWWRRRELHIYYKLLINIDLMSLQIRFCYSLCYLKYSILMPRVKMYTSFMAHQKNSCK